MVITKMEPPTQTAYLRSTISGEMLSLCFRSTFPLDTKVTKSVASTPIKIILRNMSTISTKLNITFWNEVFLIQKIDFKIIQNRAGG